MTDQQDDEIAALLTIPVHDRTAAQCERIDELEAIWEAEQRRFSLTRRLFSSAWLRVPGNVDIMAYF